MDRISHTLTFSAALASLQFAGKRIARQGWNGKGMWLKLVKTEDYHVTQRVNTPSVELLPWIGMKTADDKFVPWLASQTDILAEDWVIVE